MAAPKFYDVFKKDGTKWYTIAAHNDAEIDIAIADQLGEAVGEAKRTAYAIDKKAKKITLGDKGAAPKIEATLPLKDLVAKAKPGDTITIDMQIEKKKEGETTGALAAPVVPPPPAPPPDPDPMIQARKLPRAVEVGGDEWIFHNMQQPYDPGEGTTTTRFIFIGSCPPTTDAGWKPGQGPSEKMLEKWKDTARWYLDPKKEFVIDKNRELCWVFSGWRNSMLARLKEMFVPKPLDQINDEDIKMLGDAIAKAYNEEYKNATERIIAVTTEITTLLGKLQHKYRERDFLVGAEAAFKPKGLEEAKRALQNSARIKGIKSIQIKGTTIALFTENIVAIPVGDGAGVLDPKNKYDIGEFKVTINLYTGQVAFHNLTRQVANYHHPHVANPTGACLGEISTALPELIKKCMIVETVQILLRFLRSSNASGGYATRLAGWPIWKEPETPKVEKKAEEPAMIKEMEAIGNKLNEIAAKKVTVATNVDKIQDAVKA